MPYLHKSFSGETNTQKLKKDKNYYHIKHMKKYKINY